MNDLSRLEESTTHTYQYDADGNLVEEKDKTTTETKRYYYNSGNRLIKYEHYPTDISPADVVATYTYDIYGKRLHKVVNGTVTHFFWEGDNLSLELDVNNQPVRRYLYGLGKDSVEAHIEFYEAPPNPFDYSQQGWYSYIKNQVGTIYKVYSHQQQQVADSRTYDVFGNLITQTGTTPGRLGFQSRYLDPESGLYYFFHRYYNPTNGRFINEDPIGLSGGMNMYVFVENDIINEIDPYGLAKKKGPWHPEPGIEIRCTADDDCKTMRRKIWILQKMIKSHSGWDWHVQKPRGGNRHKKEIDDFWRAYARCQKMYEIKCKDDCRDKKRNLLKDASTLAICGVIIWKVGKFVIGAALGGPCVAIAGAVF